MRPFLLKDRYEDEIELVEEGALCLERFFGTRTFYDETNHEISNT